MSALSIGLFTYSSKPRGSVVHAACLAEALAGAGHDVTLYALEKEGEGFFRPLRCRLLLVPARPAPSAIETLVAQRIEELADFLTTLRPEHDVAHAQDCLSASGLLVARTRGVLSSALLCRTVHHVEQFESPYLERCQARSIREAELCLSVSRATQRDVLASYGRPSSLVSNGVELARFAQHSPPDAADLRAKLAIAIDAPLVVSIGGVEPRKNTLSMLDAFLAARRSRAALRWVIAGGASIFEHADYRAAFAARLAELDPESRAAVVQVGLLSERDLTLLLQSADVLLHTSRQEGFGLCVLEAMAAGTRVVVSRGAPFDEYLDDSCALRVDAARPSDIACALLSALLPAPESLATARARAARYSWQGCAEQHQAAYRSMPSGVSSARHTPGEAHASTRGSDA